MTPLERAVLTEMEAWPNGQKAYTLARLLSEKRGRLVRANSVYRVLRSLEEKGRVCKIVSINSFIALPAGKPTPQLFAICTKCSLVERLQARNERDALKHLAESLCFRAVCIHMEVLGVCSTCK